MRKKKKNNNNNNNEKRKIMIQANKQTNEIKIINNKNELHEF